MYQTKIVGEPERLGCPKGGSNALVKNKIVKRDDQKKVETRVNTSSPMV